MKNTYFGFTDNMSPLQKQRTEDVLNKRIRYNGNVVTEKEFVYSTMLNENRIPEAEENYTYYSAKTGDYTKPKTLYKLIDPKTNIFYEVNKTLFDYAVYVFNNGFLNTEKAISYIEQENTRKEAEKALQIEKERKEKEEAEQNILENERFKEWLYNETVNYSNERKINIAKSIYLDIIGNFSDNQKKLLVLIDNIDNPRCKEKLIDWLSYFNKASKKVFFHITGIKLPSTDKETKTLLEGLTKADFQTLEGYEYKPRQKHKEQKEDRTETFYILNRDQNFEEVCGIHYNKYGIDMFIRKTGNTYSLSEAKTGLLMFDGGNITEAKKKADAYITNNKEKLIKIIDDTIARYGISPRYQVTAEC